MVKYLWMTHHCFLLHNLENLLQNYKTFLPRSALITIYKAFIRPNLDYGDGIYDEAFNASFHHKLELLQYNTCLAITGAIRDTSKGKLHQELGLKSIQLRHWFRKLCFLYKIYKITEPSYLSNIGP